MADLYEGRMEDVKNRLISNIKAAEPLAFVTGDWTEKKFRVPCVKVRLSPTMTRSWVYGRRGAPSLKGNYEETGFSLHCFMSNCKVTNESKYKYAHELGDKIKTYLLEHRESGPIRDIYDVIVRESQDSSYRLSRVIVEGKLLTFRKDSS